MELAIDVNNILAINEIQITNMCKNPQTPITLNSS